MIKVLIALDDTEESTEAAALAHRLFGDDAEYLAISVFDHPPAPIDPRAAGPGTPGVVPPVAWGTVWPYERRPAPSARRDDVEELSAYDVAERKAREAAERAGLEEAELIGEVGDPADAILDAAHEYDVDIVVVGSHDRSWFSRLFSRSVSTAVVERADIPVLVAK